MGEDFKRKIYKKESIWQVRAKRILERDLLSEINLLRESFIRKNFSKLTERSLSTPSNKPNRKNHPTSSDTQRKPTKS